MKEEKKDISDEPPFENHQMKVLCCELQKNIIFHWYKHLLSLRGCPLEQIALMMGHVSGNVPNISMTANYVCDRKKISKSVISLFK